MDPWILQPDWRSRLTLIALIACLYAGVVVINNSLVFFWAADASYRFWFYPPAGVRLALVMLLGWPALLGYFIAALALVSSGIFPEISQFEDAFWVAVSRVGSLWFGLLAYGWITGIRSPWDRLTWQHLPFLAVFVSLCSALAAHFTLISLDHEAWDTFIRNVMLNVLGDTLGCIAVLIVLIQLRKAYRSLQTAR